MGLSLITRALVIIFCIIGIYCSSSQRVIERIRYLENRINSESKFRDEDYEEIIARLNGIDKRLNASLEQKDGVDNMARETGEVDLENVRNIKKDFTRLRTAFREEKSETAIIRREVPKIENNLISMKQNMDRYCVKSLNKTGQLTTLVQQADEYIKSDMTHQINQIAERQITLRNEIDVTSTLERQEFSVEAKKIAEQVKINTEKIENVDMILTKLSVHLEHLLLYDSCTRTLRTGVYKIPNGPKVFCDHSIDGGGWAVFQRRQNGDVDFYRNWTEYKTGFGDLNGDFWLGNDFLSILTATGDHELRIDMEDFNGNRAFAKYSKFKIYPEENNYKLEVSGYSGTAGDSLKYHNGMAFSTFDNDNDKSSSNCAERYHGAWWYKNCHYSNLNGKFVNIASSCKSDYTEIFWYHWEKNFYCLKSVEMKFR